jgi:hypothetical protein
MMCTFLTKSTLLSSPHPLPAPTTEVPASQPIAVSNSELEDPIFMGYLSDLSSDDELLLHGNDDLYSVSDGNSNSNDSKSHPSFQINPPPCNN